MEKLILTESNCETAIFLLNNNDQIKDLNLFISNILILLNTKKINKLSENNIQLFIDILKNSSNFDYSLIDNFIKNDNYSEKERSKKNIIYSYILSNLSSPECLYLFKINTKSKNIKKNLIARQNFIFDFIIKEKKLTKLRTRHFINKMINIFDNQIGHKINDYNNYLTQDSYIEFKDVYKEHEIINLSSDSLQHLIFEVYNLMNNEIDIPDETFNNKIESLDISINKSNPNENLKVSFLSLDSKGQSINSFRYQIKDDISAKYSLILNKNIKIYNDIDKNNFRDHLLTIYTTAQHKKYIENIFYFLINKDVYSALKESILFIENFLRDHLERQNHIFSIYNYKQIDDINTIFKNCFQNTPYYNEDMKEILNKYLNEKYKDNYALSSKMLNSLINISYESHLITKQNYIFLKFFLLNDDNEGKNFRNNIFHGIKNEYDYFCSENKNNNMMIFELTIFYIIAITYLIQTK